MITQEVPFNKAIMGPVDLQPFVSYDWKMSKIGRFLGIIDQNILIKKLVPNT